MIEESPSDGKAKLDALIQRVRSHPALYAYYLKDEPSVSMFPEFGQLAAYSTNAHY